MPNPTHTLRIGKPFRVWLEGTQAWYDTRNGAYHHPFMEAIADATARADGSITVPDTPANREAVIFYASILIDVASLDGFNGLPELNSARAAYRAATQR